MFSERETILSLVRRRGIFFRTFIILMLLAVIIVALFAFMVIPEERTALVKTMDAQAKNIAASISEATAVALLNGDYSFVVEHNMQVIKKSDGICYIITVRDNGMALVHTEKGWEQKETSDPIWKDHETATQSGIIFSTLVGKKVYHYTAPLQFSGIDCGNIYIGMSLKKYEDQVNLVYRVIFMVSGFCLIIAAVLSYFFARRLTAPILDLRAVTQKIIAGDLAARASIAVDDEVGHLAKSFNNMTDTMLESQNSLKKALEELELHRQNLEILVQNRTEQLREVNRHLQHELAERRRVESALTESEQRYRTIFETAGNANMIVEKDDTVSMINAAFEKLSGYSRGEVEGKKSWREFFSEKDRQKIKQHQEVSLYDPKVATKDYEVSFIDKAGNSRWAYTAIAHVPGAGNIVISLIDLTEIKQLEAQLLQAQKMEAIGQLAGGIAHDFNNILTAIIGYAGLLKMTLGKNELVGEYVEPIISSAEKAAHLTQGLLAFSRKQIISPKHVDCIKVIKKVENLLVRLMGEDIELRTEYEDQPVIIFADTGQLEQTVINLATNARDAMPEGGCFSIKVETTTLSETGAGEQGVTKPGKYALISVSDTGVGISKNTIDHIFDPFFTTKDVGKGTGLGLSIVYGVIKQHSGYINVYSEENAGTTFKIYLPLIKAMAEEGQPTALPKLEFGHETILVAEDDDVGRELCRIILQKFGYSVITACDGADAIGKFKANRDKIDLVLLDVVMPKKNGKETYAAIKQINPNVKALFISGYTADILHKKGIFEGDINFVSKPILPQDLSRKVRAVLDA